MRLTNLVFIVIGLEILLYLAGINQSMGESLSLISISNPAAMATGWFFTNAAWILGLGVGATVVVGFFTKASTENALIAAVSAFFIKFVADLMAIILITNSYCEAFTAPYSSCAWITWMVVAIIAPICVVFVMSALDWWRGRD